MIYTVYFNYIYYTPIISTIAVHKEDYSKLLETIGTITAIMNVALWSLASSGLPSG